MNKRIMSAGLALSLCVAMSVSTFASTLGGQVTTTRVDEMGAVNHIVTKTTAAVTLRDLQRLMDVAVNGENGAHPGDGARIINAKQLQANEWVIRVSSGDKTSTYAGDYYVTTLPYSFNTEKNEVVDAPNTARDTAIYGPSWFYCGLFEDGGSHDITGFALARRITRWPDWNNLSYTTDAYALKANPTAPMIVGSYAQASSENFVETHTVGK